MPWTESRSRDDWLAEVTRRGERIRARRRTAVSAVVATALLVPAVAVLSISVGREPEAQFQVAAAGPVPTSATMDAEPPSVLGGAEPLAPSGGAGGAGGTAVAPLVDLTTTTLVEVHRRLDAVNGSVLPGQPPRIVDDPVVRPPASGATTTTAPSSTGNTSSLASSGPAATTTTAPAGEPALSACPAADIRVTVSTEKSSYGPGEAVRFSSTLENRSATTCLVSGRAFFSVENGAGKVVSSFAYTADFMMPVKAAPGQAFTNSGSWDQRDCSGSACVQVPGGTYVVVAGWTEGGPYTGRGSFQIGA